MRILPRLRLIPAVIFAAVALLALKAFGYMIGTRHPEGAVWTMMTSMQPVVPASTPLDDVVVTGAAAEKKPAAETSPPSQPAQSKAPRTPAGVTVGAPGSGSPAERALIERLQERRQELEARARDLELRENLIKAAEKQLEARIRELKALEGTGGEASQRVKNLVTMYEAMRPKEAARIFDRLDVKALVEITNHMSPRKLSEILAQMSPESAERLTLELARRRSGDRPVPATDLPSIDQPPPG